MAIDGLSWLVQEKRSSKYIQGVVLGNGEQACIDMFANDTNAIVDNDEMSIAQLWKCLHIYYKTSRSVINHNKTGIHTSIYKSPSWLLLEGCKLITEGEILFAF